MKDFNFIFGKYGFGKSTEAALRVKKYAEDLKRNKSPENIRFSSRPIYPFC